MSILFVLGWTFTISRFIDLVLMDNVCKEMKSFVSVSSAHGDYLLLQ